MINLKTSFSHILWVIFLIFLKPSLIKVASEECYTILVEGGEGALEEKLIGFEEIKSIEKYPKCSYKMYLETNRSDFPLFDVRFDVIPQFCYKERLPKDCAEATACTKRSGIYKIQVEQYSNKGFLVACDAETENGDWLIIQKRQDGSVNFFRDWLDYEEGFGDIGGESFIGLKKLHALTNYNGPQELMIVMEDINATKAFAKYDAFAIGNETETYKLKRIGKYSGSAGDSLKYHIGLKFSTKDRDNDEDLARNCANIYTGAWWYNKCHRSNLNGKYDDNTYGKGINWYSFRGHTQSLSYVKMMIRRSRKV